MLSYKAEDGTIAWEALERSDAAGKARRYIASSISALFIRWWRIASFIGWKKRS